MTSQGKNEDSKKVSPSVAPENPELSSTKEALKKKILGKLLLCSALIVTWGVLSVPIVLYYTPLPLVSHFIYGTVNMSWI